MHTVYTCSLYSRFWRSLCLNAFSSGIQPPNLPLFLERGSSSPALTTCPLGLPQSSPKPHVDRVCRFFLPILYNAGGTCPLSDKLPLFLTRSRPQPIGTPFSSLSVSSLFPSVSSDRVRSSPLHSLPPPWHLALVAAMLSRGAHRPNLHQLVRQTYSDAF